MVKFHQFITLQHSLGPHVYVGVAAVVTASKDKPTVLSNQRQRSYNS